MAVIEKIEDGDWTEDQIAKINQAKQYKDSGDQAFKAGNVKDALRSYHLATMYAKGITRNAATAMNPAPAPPPGEVVKPKTELDEMTEKIYANMSACHLKQENWARCIETADAALSKNGNNYKALFRKGKAYGELGFFEKAEPILIDLLKRNPADAPTINAELERQRAKDKQRSREASQKMKGWMNREKKKSESDAPAAAVPDDETMSAGPPPTSSAKIEEIPEGP